MRTISVPQGLPVREDRLAFWRKRDQKRDADHDKYVVTPAVELRPNLETTISHFGLRSGRS